MIMYRWKVIESHCNLYYHSLAVIASGTFTGIMINCGLGRLGSRVSQARLHPQLYSKVLNGPQLLANCCHILQKMWPWHEWLQCWCVKHAAWECVYAHWDAFYYTLSIHGSLYNLYLERSLHHRSWSSSRRLLSCQTHWTLQHRRQL